MSILIAGAGIAGLTFALTCHELGLDVQVCETAPEIHPLGVGINLQPNAIRELWQLGLETDLRAIGVEAEEWSLFYYGAQPVWTEPRGTQAGYRWPQFSVHRGQLQLCLLNAVRSRLGEAAVHTDARLVEYENQAKGVRATFQQENGETFTKSASLLIGADGINSQVRQQMYPTQGSVHWNGAIMWRGVSRAKPPRGKNAFVMVGGRNQRFICYPIEPLDSKGETLLNWIAELRVDDQSEVNRSDWNQSANPAAFMDQFEDWQFGWLDVPEIVARAEGIWEYPMVDRDPVDRWVDGRVALIGDAAHAMFPHGSNGASQGIVDARVLGAALLHNGICTDALQSYETRQLEPTNALILRARGEGPIGILLEIEDRVAQGASLDEANVPAEVAAYMARFKTAAGLDRDILNAAGPTIPQHASLAE